MMVMFNGSTNSRFSNFFLLNGSFSNNIGLCDGKSAVALYYYYARYNDSDCDIGFSILEEIIEQIHVQSSLSFGAGASGVGILLEHLVQSGFLVQDTNEILEEAEAMLFKAAYDSTTRDIGIANGISGIGLYFLHRMQSVSNSGNQLFHNLRLRDAAITCIFQVERIVTSYRVRQEHFPDKYSIWDGLSGALLFLHKARELNLYEPRISLLIEELAAFIFSTMDMATFSWDKIHTWYVLLHIHQLKNQKELYASHLAWYKKFMQRAQASLSSLNFHDAAFIALLLKLIYKEHEIQPALHVSDAILKRVHGVLQNNSLPAIFTFDAQGQCIPMGLHKGVCGTALPLRSLETGNYNWLKIIGIYA